MESSDLQEPYSAPVADVNAGGVAAPWSPDAIRVAGVLMLIAAASTVAVWAVSLVFNWTPSWTTALTTVTQAALGLGLYRVGRQFVIPTLLFLVGLLALSLAPMAKVALQTSIVYFLGGAMMGSIKVAPFLLLLLGRPERARVKLAIVLFVVAELITLGGVAFRMQKLYSLGE